MKNILHKIPWYPVGWMFFALSLPSSRFFISVSIIILTTGWILEGDFHRKYLAFLERKSLWAIVLLYGIFLLSLINSTNMEYAFHDLRIKLPLLLIPLIAGTRPALTKKEFNIVLVIFSLAVFIFSSIVAYHIVKTSVIRESSVFISHIRLSLMVVMAIFIVFKLSQDIPGKYQLIAWIAIVWYVIFLFMLQALTGIVILFLLFAGYFIHWTRNIPNLLMKSFFLLVFISGIVLGTGFVINQVVKFYTIEKISPDNLEKVTRKGNLYTHDPQNKLLENGRYIYLYVCEKELREEWNMLSNIDYDGKDKKGHDIKYTLMRYLTSLGLRKDVDGMNRLGTNDIKTIENGYANYIFKNPKRFSNRIYTVIWEIDTYLKGGNPSGHSVTQRLEYVKTGYKIFIRHVIFGVGIGDVQDEFNRQYEKDHTMLAPEWRLRSHNQLLSFLISVGLPATVIILGCYFYLFYYEARLKGFYPLLFFVVSILSMLNEDTAETHVGVSFLAFFTALFLFSNPYKKDE